MYFDWGYELLKEILHLLDKQLQRLEEVQERPVDPEALGLYDSGEATIGLGFVACQQYLSTIYGQSKVEKLLALGTGPQHYSGMTTAEIVNHSANYWKHHE